jgi:G3E family GTPase
MAYGDSAIWTTVVTGFLGSGKTTLINALLRSSQLRDAVVIVNEFGEIAIDHDLMRIGSERLVRLDNGCLCCALRGQLLDTLHDLWQQRRAGRLPRFNRVVIETTGLARPAAMLESLSGDPLVRSCYAQDGIVATIDVCNGATSLERFPESVEQIAVADRIVLTKADLLVEPTRETTLASLIRRVHAINPAASTMVAEHGAVEACRLVGCGLFAASARQPDLGRWLAGGDVATLQASAAPQDAADERNAPHHRHTGDVRTFSFVHDRPIALGTLQGFLEMVARHLGADLLRVKGLVDVAERPGSPAIVQGAQELMHALAWLPAWPGEDRRTRIVFITRGIASRDIEDAFATMEGLMRRTAGAARRAAEHAP